MLLIALNSHSPVSTFAAVMLTAVYTTKGERGTMDVTPEVATKLHENKEEILACIIDVLDMELLLEVYKETQRIEAEGIMTIKIRNRCRTPRAVFLISLKHQDFISVEDQNALFSENRLKVQKKHKDLKNIIRDRKVEELKKRLTNEGAELTSLSVREDHMVLGEDKNQKPGYGKIGAIVEGIK
uniref:Phosphorylated adapter RNA export protein n=1 Tax=Glossina brevipalpis TaxID=37001 RepID=A0A1A9W1I1_9MUSC